VTHCVNLPQHATATVDHHHHHHHHHTTTTTPPPPPHHHHHYHHHTRPSAQPTLRGVPSTCPQLGHPRDLNPAISDCRRAISSQSHCCSRVVIVRTCEWASDVGCNGFGCVIERGKGLVVSFDCMSENVCSWHAMVAPTSMYSSICTAHVVPCVPQSLSAHRIHPFKCKGFGGGCLTRQHFNNQHIPDLQGARKALKCPNGNALRVACCCPHD
jgi:hypothetical protein